ncbi:MAG TPA: LysM domain-containing protein, partial [Ramlibacter sp.]|uniref:LysM peptidoglycan-binding domain-containing protein n=1 Tax=Ramlibacter sp. TaxID=1917967 RepID=UPI002C4F8FE3
IQGNGTELRRNAYDGNGNLLAQRVYASDSNNLKYSVWYDQDGNGYADVDGAGNVQGYVLQDPNQTLKYAYTYEAGESYREKTETGTRTSGTGTGGAGTTTSVYDANGYLVGVKTDQQANDRKIVNDSTGKVLYVNQNGHVQRELIANGEVLGRYGEVVNSQEPKDKDGNPVFESIADFAFGFDSVAGNTPDTPDRTHVVGAGDTLEALAQAYYGDSRLWYRIADANGLSSNADLKPGAVLKIPGTEVNANSATTFKPYDPSAVIGDKTPVVPVPKQHHSWFGDLLAIVVAIVVTSFLGAVPGNVALQAVEMAAGNQERFSWKSVAMSAVSAGVTQGLGGVDFTGSGVLDSAGNGIARAAVANTLTQGVGVATGMQKSFDWSGPLASAVGAGVGQAVGPALGATFGDSAAGRFAAGVATGLVAGAATAVAHGGKVTVQQIAVDAFGQMIGSSLASVQFSGGSSSTAAAPQPGELGSGTFDTADADSLMFERFGADAPNVSAMGAPAAPEMSLEQLRAEEIGYRNHYEVRADGRSLWGIAQYMAGAGASNAQVNAIKNGLIAANPALADPNSVPANGFVNTAFSGVTFDSADVARIYGADARYQSAAAETARLAALADVNNPAGFRSASPGYAAAQASGLSYGGSWGLQDEAPYGMALARVQGEWNGGAIGGRGTAVDPSFVNSETASAQFTHAQPSDHVGQWLQGLNVPEIPGVGWLSQSQATSSAAYWQSRLDSSNGNPIYALAQGAAQLWADHAQEVGTIALSMRGGTTASSRLGAVEDSATPLGSGWSVMSPRGLGSATGPLPKGYVTVSRWVGTDEAAAWIENGGTAIPAGIGAGNRVYVTDFASAKPGGTGPIRIDFAVPQQALGSGGKTEWHQIFQPAQRVPVYNVRIHVPDGITIPRQ